MLESHANDLYCMTAGGHPLAFQPRQQADSLIAQCNKMPRAALLGCAFIALATAVAQAVASDQVAPTSAASASEPADRSPSAKPAEVQGERSYALPAGEIIGFDFLLNRIGRHFGDDRDDFRVTSDSIRRNLHSGWGTDKDPFQINQLGHPYQGAMYHGFARSAGFDYWQSFGYTFAGSALWELAGETTRPSRNDQVASGIGGTFLGEALFRMSNLVLEQGGGLPRFWREAAGAAIDPSAGFNRLAFGDRFSGIFSSRNAAYYSRLQFGYSGSVKQRAGTSTTEFRRNEAQVDFSLDYGLPGSPDYEYTRPFDYFNFQATASSANALENVMTRGLLVGRSYAAGDDYRGVWGLYGSYDYIAPQTYRVSTTALSIGSTAQWWLGKTWSLQGTAMTGLGYAAVGTTRGAVGERDYNYGIAPQALLALRLTDDDKASLDLTAREYFVSDVGSGTSGGHDNIIRADASFTWRIAKQRAITIKVLGNRRDAKFTTLGSSRQTQVTAGIFYTFLGQDHFGTIDWR
ncbi:MAG TPA: DUF3943 domain-containing protein [Thiobacillaceae bacterium]|nr:DUF3943 domain-containing protein [Thiobacillaceae bacterium]